MTSTVWLDDSNSIGVLLVVFILFAVETLAVSKHWLIASFYLDSSDSAYGWLATNCKERAKSSVFFICALTCPEVARLPAIIFSETMWLALGVEPEQRVIFTERVKGRPDPAKPLSN